jgi:cell division protein FtsB
MKHLALAAFAGLSIYLVLNLVFGPGGTRETERLAAHKERLEANIESLEKRSRSLENEVMLLRTSPDEIELRSRKLGYYRPNDAVIRFEGWDRPERPPTPGTEIRPFVSAAERSDTGVSAIRSAAISAALLTLIVSLMGERIAERRRNP